MANFTPIRTNADGLNISNIPIEDGQMIAVYDTGELYIDKGNERQRYSDIVFDTYYNIVHLIAPLTKKLYFATDTNQLLQVYKSGNNYVWVILNSDSGSDSEIITKTDAAVSFELNNNKIYYLTNANITSITLTANSSLAYCTICFTSGTNTTFSPPTGAKCIGYDCTGGIFSPVSGREYQIAVDKLNNVLTFYVLVASLNLGSIPTDSALSTTSTNPVANSVITAALNNKSDVSSVVTNTDAAISLTLANNTVYRCTNASITDLTISGVATGFIYASLIFTSPSTATTFSMPNSGYYCKGAACEDGEFTPDADMRYNLAIENEGDRIAIYVMKAL